MENIGKLNINLIRGNDKIVTLSFFELDLQNVETPMDLRIYESIRMDVKVDNNINSPVILALAIDSGIIIIGTDHNVLRIAFDRSFSSTNGIQFNHDILFKKDSLNETLLKGVINIQSVTTL